MLKKNFFFIFFIVLVNSVCGLNFAEPSYGLKETNSKFIFIKWINDVSINNKTIKLYYDIDTDLTYKKEFYDTTILGNQIKSFYNWNISNIYSGRYYIHIISTENNSNTEIVTTYSTVNINNYSDTLTLINNTQEISVLSKSIVIDKNDLNNDGLEDLIFTGTYEFNDINSLITESQTSEEWEYKLQDKNSNFINGNMFTIAGNCVTGGIKTEDLNRDGKIDVLISVTEISGNFPALSTSDKVYLYYQSDNLTFTKSELALQALPNSGLPIHVATELTTIDFNGDTLPDIAVLQADFYDSTQPGRLHIFIQDSNHNFSEIISGGYIVEPFPYRLTVGDYNNDYKLDIAIVCKYSNNIQIIYQGSNGNISDSEIINIGSQPVTLRNLNINNDDYTDFAVTLKNEDKVKLYINDQSGTFINFGYLNTNNNPQGLAIYDYNLDGLEDIAVTCENSDTLGSIIIYKHLLNDTFVLNNTLNNSDTPLDMVVLQEYISGRPLLAAISHNKKIILNKSNPNNYPPVFDNLLINTFDTYLTINLKVKDNDGETITGLIYIDNDNSAFDGNLYDTNIIFQPYDTKTIIINSDSILQNSFYIYLGITDNIDTNYKYYNHLITFNTSSIILSSSNLFNVDVNWNSYDTISQDTLFLNLNDTNVIITIKLNDSVLYDTLLNSGDTIFSQILNFDTGFNDIFILVQDIDGNTQQQNIKVLKNINILIPSDTFVLLSDSENIIALYDTNNVNIKIFNDTNFWQLNMKNNDTIVFTFQKNNFDTLPLIDTNYIFCDTFTIELEFYSAQDTYLSNISGNDSIFISICETLPLNSKIFFYDILNDTYKIYDSNNILIPFNTKFILSIVKENLLFDNSNNNIDSDIIIYPNPYVPFDNNNSTGNLLSGIYIRNLNKNDKIEIYNITGELKKSLIYLDNNNYYNWDCKDKNNKLLSSGVYFILIKNSFRKVVKKFMVIR